MTDRPEERRFFINDAIGLPDEEYNKIAAYMHRLGNSDMLASDIVKESVKGRNHSDVMVGFMLSNMLSECVVKS